MNFRNENCTSNLNLANDLNVFPLQVSKQKPACFYACVLLQRIIPLSTEGRAKKELVCI